METVYYVKINGYGNYYMNTLDKIKDALYDLFGEIVIAQDDDVMIYTQYGMTIEIKPCED